jgi:hypothetical protein
MSAPLLASDPRQLARRAVALLLAVVALQPLVAGPDRASAAGPAARPVAGPVAMPAGPGQFADDGLAVDGVTTLDVLPEQGVIRVTVDVTLTNQVPDEVVAGGVRYFYWDEIGIPTLAGADALTATSGGTALTVTTEAVEDEPFQTAVVRLPRRLRYGQTQSLQLAYELRNQPDGTQPLIRVGEAYAFVLPIPFGDPGATDVHVRVPSTYDVESSGDHWLYDVSGGPAEGTYTYSVEDTDPEEYDLLFSVYDTDRLVSQVAEGDHDIEVRAWPEDPEWGELVLTQVHDGLPVLEELLGIPWPVEERLQVDESVTPILFGYGGWYDDLAHRIEITDEADAAIVLHELAHAWINPGLFGSRWVTEGLADEFAARTLEATTGELPPTDPIDPADPARIALGGWLQGWADTPEEQDRQAYGYNTSFAVVRLLSEEIGIDALARVVQAEHDDVIAYRGDPDAEEWTLTGDWRRFLDLLEEVGGSEGAEALFRAHVAAPADLAALDDRAEARVALDALDEAGDGWSAPFAVRRTMGHWRFDQATGQIAASRALLDVRDEIAAVLEPAAVEVPAGLEVAYETATDLDEVEALAADLLEVAELVVEADDEVRGGHDPLTTIGLLGSDADERFDDALAAFDDADAGATRDALDDATATVAAAQGQGLLRAGGVLLVVALGAGAVLLLRRRRRRRQQGAAAGAEAVADLEGLGEAERLQLADVDLEARSVAPERFGEGGGDDARPLLDEPEGRPGPGPVGGGGVEAVEPPAEGGDVVG